MTSAGARWATLALLAGAALAWAGPAAEAATFAHEPAEIRAGEPVRFTGLAGPGQPIIVNWTWSWDLEGGVSYGNPVDHVFTQAGAYVVQVVAVDENRNATFFGDTVQVQPPLGSGMQILPPSLDWLYWAAPLLVAVTLLSISYLVIVKGQPDIYNFVFFFMYCASGVKSLTEALLALTEGFPSLQGPLRDANEWMAYLFVPLFLWFVLVFPRPVHPWLRQGKRGAVTLGLAVPFILLNLTGLAAYETGTWSRVNLFNAFASVTALAGIGLLVYHAKETDSDEERRRIRLMTVTFVLTAVSTLVLAALNILFTSAVSAGDAAGSHFYLLTAALVGLIIGPIVEIIGCLVLMYAILRYQLLGIERLAMRITRAGIFALVMPSIFLIVSNSVQQLVQVTVLKGIKYDFIIAGFLAAPIMFPVQKFATFVVNRLFPGAAAMEPAYQARRRMEIFETQLRYSLLDGALNPKEVSVLSKLQHTLGLNPDEFRTVVGKFPANSLAGLAHPSPPAASSGTLTAG